MWDDLLLDSGSDQDSGRSWHVPWPGWESGVGIRHVSYASALGPFGSNPFFFLFCAFVMFVLDGVSFVRVALRPPHLLVRIDGSL